MPYEKCIPVSAAVDAPGEDPKRHFQVVLLGGARVGKTSIVSQFLYDKEVTGYKPTIEELHRGEYEIQGETLVLDLLDTAGSHPFPAMRELAIKQSHAIVLVYAIDDASSWQVIQSLREEVVALRGLDFPIVVVGNKSDLDKERKVSDRVAETVACLDWGHAWLETSAFDPLAVLKIFKTVLLKGKVHYRLSPAVERRRKSLPSYTQKHKQERFILKRHSCNVS